MNIVGHLPPKETPVSENKVSEFLLKVKTRKDYRNYVKEIMRSPEPYYFYEIQRRKYEEKILQITYYRREANRYDKGVEKNISIKPQKT